MVVSDCTAQSFDELIVDRSSATVQLNGSFIADLNLDEWVRGELRSLIETDCLGCAVKGEGNVEGHRAEVDRLGASDTPTEQLVQVSVHDHREVEETLLEGNIVEVGITHVVEMDDRQSAQKVGAFVVLRVLGFFWSASERMPMSFMSRWTRLRLSIEPVRASNRAIMRSSRSSALGKAVGSGPRLEALKQSRSSLVSAALTTDPRAASLETALNLNLSDLLVELVDVEDAGLGRAFALENTARRLEQLCLPQ